MKKSLGEEFDEDTFKSEVNTFFHTDLDGDTKEFNYDEFEKI